jgi:hypothetical protein
MYTKFFPQVEGMTFGNIQGNICNMSVLHYAKQEV